MGLKIRFGSYGINVYFSGINVYVMGKEYCLNCGEELEQLPKKRRKVFCDSTCRSNYWQKSDRLEKDGKTIDEIIKILSAAAKPKKKPEVIVDVPPTAEVKEVGNNNVQVSIPKKKNLAQFLADVKNGTLDMEELKKANLPPNQQNLILRKLNQ